MPLTLAGTGLAALTFFGGKGDTCTTIRIADTSLCVEVVATEEKIIQGLSGRTEIGADGMLFSMPTTERHGFWMKDMHFSIDIVWINGSNTITEITYNLTPKTYPKSFHPQQPARFVLELPAGTAKEGWIGAAVQ
ncbi:hypothetical protein A3C87_01890 [Candidatus Kaiserbacteria bacterium RIFCSPHIGHO2_02_FULL_49_34]|uniref:DUF192 domain-containing protein n=1 Tax=Candidatus Kaiserbacteria bacterium RIFCSPHIGHO2_02_FULL_49_34 TaxID=1798491 RepID=A0A1F6DHZ5_9BACT|nr:MAG: hypothetical protein A3C87_01890 [Candidatus Kaiserbacteria bacterium RIFCSPHIGHO2_02_FULL_49_34]